MSPRQRVGRKALLIRGQGGYSLAERMRRTQRRRKTFHLAQPAAQKVLHHSPPHRTEQLPVQKDMQRSGCSAHRMKSECIRCLDSAIHCPMPSHHGNKAHSNPPETTADSALSSKSSKNNKNFLPSVTKAVNIEKSKLATGKKMRRYPGCFPRHGIAEVSVAQT